MGSVLSQDEVDALLKGVAGDDVVSEEEDIDGEYDPEAIVPFDLLRRTASFVDECPHSKLFTIVLSVFSA